MVPYKWTNDWRPKPTKTEWNEEKNARTQKMIYRIVRLHENLINAMLQLKRFISTNTFVRFCALFVWSSEYVDILIRWGWRLRSQLIIIVAKSSRVRNVTIRNDWMDFIRRRKREGWYQFEK